MMWEWGQWLGRPRCPYVRRWMLQTRLGSIRLHHWVAPDDFRASHNHPWWFVTLVLWGGYVDANADGSDELGPGSVRFRRAGHRHRVVPTGWRSGECWTLVVTGPARKEWGFFPFGTLRAGEQRPFLPADQYARLMGDAPCSAARFDGDRLGSPR